MPGQLTIITLRRDSFADYHSGGEDLGNENLLRQKRSSAMQSRPVPFFRRQRQTEAWAGYHVIYSKSSPNVSTAPI
eukprot:7325880-Pyramimonas_sp.AAC.1